jgi:cysteine desulfurase
MQPIYLDHNATTPLAAEAAEAMARCAATLGGNPASMHSYGRRARQWLEDARERLAERLGANLAGPDADTLVFTSGGTESNNLAVRGIAAAAGPPGHVLVSAIEHPAVSQVAEQLAREGFEVESLDVASTGVTHIEHLADRLRSDTRVVALMLANHETGALQPVADAASICRARRVPLHTDAVAAVGQIPVDFHALGADTLAASAHKFNGPVGIGLLLVRHGVTLRPLMWGGFQQGSLRPGTEPVVLAIGMCAALEAWHAEHSHRERALSELRARFETALTTELADVEINAAAANRLPGTSSIAFRTHDRQELLVALDLAGVACSTGSACASGSPEPSPVLRAMGLDEPSLRGTLRFSLGHQTTAAEVDEAARRIIRVCKELRRRVSPPEKLPQPRVALPNSV